MGPARSLQLSRIVEDNAPQIIKKWLEAYAAAACAGEIEDTSAGAGPGREYAYMHYTTRDDRHHILVFHGAMHRGQLEVIGECFEGSGDEIQARVRHLTHPPERSQMS